MIQIFLPKTAEKLKTLWGFVGQHFAVWGAILSHTTEKNSSRYAFWRVPHTTPRIRTLRTDLLYAPKASVSRVLVTIRSEVPPKGAAGAPSGKSAHIYHGSEDHAYDHNKHFFTLHEEEQRTRAQTKALARPPVKRVAQQHLFPT